MNTNGKTDRPTVAVDADRRDDIIVGIDESPASKAALNWAADLSRATGHPLRLMHTWQLPIGASDAMIAGGQAGYLEAIDADARARTTRWVLDNLDGDAAQVRWTLQVAEGSPGPALVLRSKAAWLLVVGTREHRGMRRAITGSVSHYCISHSQVPVVAVPGPSAPSGSSPGERDAIVVGPLL